VNGQNASSDERILH